MATPLLQQIKERLGNQACFYVTRDIERALGMVPDESLPYFIITNATDYAKEVASKNPNVMLVESGAILDSWQLLEHPETVKKIRPNDFVMVFKNTTLIESICKKNNWQLLNPSAELANKVEEKISQVDWLGELAKYLPPHKITTAEKVKWNNQKFILQFNRAHTGSGTILVENEQQLREIQTKFPEREVRVTKFIKGPVFTSNNIVHNSGVKVGNISYQITGLKPFTDLQFATVGNDWSLPHKLLSAEQKKYFAQIVTDIGEKLRQDGWRGLFGVDIIMNEQTGNLHLLEINARQPASTTYESWLQSSADRNHAPLHTPSSVLPLMKGEGTIDDANDDHLSNRPLSPSLGERQGEGYVNITTFQAHLANLLGISFYGCHLQPINNGSQIIYRVPNNSASPSGNKIAEIVKQLHKLDLNVIQYNNKKPGTDLLRIQALQGIMADHDVLNDLGREIDKIIQRD